jgi:ribose/xylose/arabinose/galactoside ABC-type transport system permease subunit
MNTPLIDIDTLIWFWCGAALLLWLLMRRTKTGD